MVLFKIIFITAVFIEYLIFDGYLRLLQLLATIRNTIKGPTANFPKLSEEDLPTVTILTTVYNEEKRIQDKIDNILLQDYPEDLMEIVIASDGSTDSTDDIVRSCKNTRVKLIRYEGGAGKSRTQNYAISKIKSQIVIFTDADTSFNIGFLRAVVAPFVNPNVGGVDGHLLFRIDSSNDISNCQGHYWRYELKLRELESEIGILAVASGACMAIRRNLFTTIEDEYGEDCILPLEIVKQGFKMIHASDAIAYDQMSYDIFGELQTRARMTQRNLQGTWSRKQLLNPLISPGYAFSLWFHKILRWFSPVLLILITLSLLLLTNDHFYYRIIFMAVIVLFSIGFLGLIAEFKKWKIRGLKIIFSFLLANIGFLSGLIRVLKKKKISRYK